MIPRPSSRDGFQIAIICALPAEYDAVYDSFDDRWDEMGKDLGKASGDPNRYVTGLMGDLAVVLVLLPGMGKANAASAAASLRSSYSNLKWALLVGICGAVPQVDGAEVLLGDVIISRYVVQHDFGRQYSDEFVPKKTIEDTLGRPNKEIRILNALLETRSGRDELEKRTAEFLQRLQAKVAKTKYRGMYDYPGTTNDKLFKKDYRHKHQDPNDCKICDACSSHVDPVCLKALEHTCAELKCSDMGVDARGERFQERKQLEQQDSVAAQAPVVFMGGIASGDKVMKSAQHRDSISQFHKVIAFEMEGAGVWDEMSCIVVKGVCDYADSHKQKNWQNFAASTAASASKALLAGYFQANKVKGQNSGLRSYYIPPAKNDMFVGRKDVISSLTELLFNKGTKRVALVGLGGIGKTQVALQVAFWAKENMPDYSVFWMSALSSASFEQACGDMAKNLGISTTDEDIKETIRTYLSSGKAGKWLLVLDNADDETIVYQSSDRSRRILDFIPQSDDGRLLLTTRSQKVAVKIARNKVIKLPPMSFHEARDLLEETLSDTDQLEDQELVTKLLEKLTYLPLAIAQSTAYMEIHEVPVAEYLRLCESTSLDMIQLMSEAFLDDAHYTESQGAVATTWFISFKHIHETNASAAHLLSFITWIEPKAIPWSMLPSLGSEQEKTQAIGTLRGYGFLSEREEEGVFDMHSLVHLVMQSWTYKQGADDKTKTDVLMHLTDVFPSSDWENRELWRQYMPHALSIFRACEGVGASKGTKLGLRLGRCLYEDGRIRESVQVLKWVTEMDEISLADDDPDRLTSQHELARAYQANGQVKEALELLQHIVAIEAISLAEDHPSRLASQHGLARAYQANGQVKEALKLLQHVVAIQAISLAEDHPDRLVSEKLLQSML
ncbi:Nephrocystin-3 [Ilyonectria robusta]